MTAALARQVALKAAECDTLADGARKAQAALRQARKERNVLLRKLAVRVRMET